MTGMSISRILNRLKWIFFNLVIVSMLIGCNTEKDNNNSATAEKNGSIVSENKGNNLDADKEISYASIDWDHYEVHMSEDEKKDFSEYKSVLTNEDKFYFLKNENEEIFLNDLLKAMNAENPPQIDGVVLLDLDNQNGKELIVAIGESGGHYLVLTRDNYIYGRLMSARSFEELQKDGKYLAAGGAGDLYFRRMKIDSSGVEETLIGEVHGEEKEDGSYGDRLEVGGQVISESLEDWMAENYNNPVEWIQ